MQLSAKSVRQAVQECRRQRRDRCRPPDHHMLVYQALPKRAEADAECRQPGDRFGHNRYPQTYKSRGGGVHSSEKTLRRRIMEKPNPQSSTSHQQSGRRSRWLWVLTIGSLLVILLALLSPRQGASPAPPTSMNAARQSPVAHGAAVERAH